MNLFKKSQTPWILISLLVLAPFVYLGWHGMPASDDYYDYKILSEHGLFGGVWFYYLNWSGRFVSYSLAFLLNPLHLGEALGSAISNTLFLSMLVSMAFFQSKIYVKLFKPGQDFWPTFAIILCLWLMYLPRPVELLFWFTGAIAYLIGPFLVSAWVFLHLNEPSTTIKKGLYILTPFLIAGGSEINILIMGFVLLLIFTFQEKYRENKRLISAVAISFLLGAGLELFSPGSSGRMNYFEHTAGNDIKNLSFSLKSSLNATWFYARDWTRSSPVLLSALLLFMLPGGIKSRPIKLHKKLVAASWLLVIPALYFPFYYGTGMSNVPDRLNNIAFLAFVTGLIFSAPVLLSSIKVKMPKSIAFLIFVIIIWQGSYTSRLRTAVHDIKTVKEYKFELSSREKLVSDFKVKNSPQDTLFLPQIEHIPYTIFYGDLKEDTGHWYNEGFAFYHKIGFVVCLPKEEYDIRKQE